MQILNTFGLRQSTGTHCTLTTSTYAYISSISFKAVPPTWLVHFSSSLTRPLVQNDTTVPGLISTLLLSAFEPS